MLCTYVHIDVYVSAYTGLYRYGTSEVRASAGRAVGFYGGASEVRAALGWIKGGWAMG